MLTYLESPLPSCGNHGALPSEPGILRLLCWLETKVTIDMCLALYPSPLCCRASTVQDLEGTYQGAELSCWHHGSASHFQAAESDVQVSPTLPMQTLSHASGSYLCISTALAGLDDLSRGMAFFWHQVLGEMTASRRGTNSPLLTLMAPLEKSQWSQDFVATSDPRHLTGGYCLGWASEPC